MENELTKQLNERKAVIDQLREKLNLLSDQKEEWFSKKEELNEKIAALIGEIKKSKTARDECSKVVKDFKLKRDELNTELKLKSDALKQFKKEHGEIPPGKDPGFLKCDIERLEQTIETSVMSFDKEKQLMKRINELRKQYKESEQTMGIFNTMNGLIKEVNELRAQANGAHRTVQDKAKESQDKHEAILMVSKQVDELRKEEQDAFAKFLDFKIKFAGVNEKLKVELLEFNKISGQMGEKKAEAKEQKHRKLKQELDIKEEVVEEKIKKRKRLTTEDLLVYQQQMEQDEQK